MKHDRKIFSGVMGNFGLTMVSAVAGFVQFRLLLHFLPMEQAGIWLLFVSVGGYMVLLDLGLGPTLGREISFSIGSRMLAGEELAQEVGTLIRTCAWAALALAVPVGVLGFTVGWLYLRTTISPALAPSAHLAWNIYIVSTLISLIGQGWFAGISGMGRVFVENLLRGIGQVIGLALLAIALWYHLGLAGLAVASLLQAAITVAQARKALRLGKHDLFKLGRFDFALIRRIVGPSIKYAATTLGGILILQTDNLVIASTLGTALIPNYQAVAKLVTFFVTLSMALIISTTPFISRAHSSHDMPEIRRLLNRNLKISLASMVTLGSVLACFADKIIAVWLGEGHFVGFAIVFIFLLVMLLETHHVALANAVMATGDVAFFVPALLAGVLNIVFSIFLARRMGLVGVALGTLAAQALTNNWYAPWYAMRLFHIRLVDHFRSIVAPVLLLAAITLGAGYLTRSLSTSFPPLAATLVGACSVGLVGALCSYFFVFSRSERLYLMEQAAKLLGATQEHARLP
jgi:O-antigen/teichoic acid export membrane protein